MRTIRNVSSVTISHATGTLTLSGTPSAGDTVTIDGKQYVFRSTLSTGPTVPNEVWIDGSAANALDNLKLAVNAGAGIGTKYSTGTVAHTTVEATTNSDTVQTFQALTDTIEGNAIVMLKTGANLAVTDLFTGGGVIVITGTLTEDYELTQPQQQITIGNFPTANPTFARNMRLTNEAFLSIRYGSDNSVAMHVEALAAIAIAVEPTQSWVPTITTQPVSLVKEDDETAVFTVAANSPEAGSNSYQWQYSADYGETWANITGATTPTITGATFSDYTTVSLSVALTTTGITGGYFRCVVTNLAGSTNSNSAILTVNEATP